jgi:hypothetical protein
MMTTRANWSSLGFATLLTLLTAGVGWGAQSPLKTEHFDRDPGWEGHNNRIELKKVPVVQQDFGYSATQFTGKAAGEIGGQVTRTPRPAYYAAAISPSKAAPCGSPSPARAPDSTASVSWPARLEP